MRTAFSAFLAVLVTLTLFVIMAFWVDPPTDSRRYAEWSEAAQTRQEAQEWRLYDAVQLYVDSATACSMDSDCTIQAFGCPLDCFSVVAKDQVERIKDMKSEVSRRTGMGCIYGCAGPPVGARAVCIGGQCRLGVARHTTAESSE